MTFAKFMFTTAAALFTLWAVQLPLAAQSGQPNQQHPHPHYKLIDLGTLGGTSSYFEPYSCCSPLVNGRGTAAASAETSMPDPFPSYCFFPDCLAAHTIAWEDGVVTDLGPLPGGENSAPQWISANGLIAGLSENGVTDPLVPGLPELRAAFWQNGTIVDLGTLGGGYEAIANAVNSRGQVIGETTNTIPDPFSQAFDQSIGVPYQTRAFLWQNGAMQDLGTLGGPDAAATVMNERGQIAGASYINSTPNPNGPFCSSNVPTVHPFLWQNGKMINLGSLGGACGYAAAINDRGQVAGGSTLPGDQASHPTLWDHGTLTDLGTFGGNDGYTNWINERGAVVGAANFQDDITYHAALWKNGVMTDLETLPGYCSSAQFINSRDQIVGGSFACDGSTNAATLWQDGTMFDLNSLIARNSGLHLDVALDINDRGEIAGQGSTSNGDTHAFLLVPCGEGDSGIEDCDYSRVDASAANIRSAPATQYPAAITPLGQKPGKLNRFRFLLRRRTLAPRTAPPPAPPANTATPDWSADHRLDTQFRGNTGYCVEEGGVLSGSCAAFVLSFGYCSAQPSADCTSGQKAKQPGNYDCLGFHQYSADLGRQCSFVIVASDFSLSASASTPTTVSPGASSTSTVNVIASGGFSGSVALTCAVMPLPTLAPACSISPRSTTPGTPATLTVSTTPLTTGALPSGNSTGLSYALCLPLIGLAATRVDLGSKQNGKEKLTALALACLLFAGLFFQVACGGGNGIGGGSPGTPAGTYAITITGTDTSGTLVRSVITSLTVQ